MKRLVSTFAGSVFCATSALADPAVYDTPQSALDALISAVEEKDQDALLKVFGPESEDMFNEDEVERQQVRAEFLAMYRDGYRFRPGEEMVTLLMGEDSWPFPIPLVRGENGWSFDVEEGREEIIDREIGRNELDIIELLEAYVELQSNFRQVDHDRDGVMEFARSIISDAGARDGLFWPGAPGPVGALLARAEIEGWSDGENDYDPEPFSGYYFRILHEQGDSAPGGARSYLAGNNLVGGHALLAVPAEYDVTGVHAFLVGENGIIFEADLGEDTLEMTKDMMTYDPGELWIPIE